jgi:hypothetical protein
MGKVLTTDGVFQRMMKVNNMERYDHDKFMFMGNPVGHSHHSGNSSAQPNN